MPSWPGGIALLGAARDAEGQQAGNVYRIGFLGPAAKWIYMDALLNLGTGLRERGYVEGKDIVFE